MGDVAMTVPVLRALVQQHPQVQVTVVSRPFFKAFFADIPRVNFLEFDEKHRHKGFLGLVRLYRDLRSLKVDAFADLHNVLRSKIVRNIFAIEGIPMAFVNKAREEKKALTRAENKVFKQLPLITERHALVFAHLGFPVDLDDPIFPKKKTLSAETLEITGEKNHKWIGIAPFAQYDSKVYPLDLMQKVIDDLANNGNHQIFLFGGGKSEIELLEKMSQNKSNVINMAGKIKFQQELAIISHLDVMLSMDSGNSHIAAMLGVPVVTLWGATHPFAGFMPFNQPIENTITADRTKYPKLPTSIYGNKKVEGYEDAMRSILPETVVEKIMSSL